MHTLFKTTLMFSFLLLMTLVPAYSQQVFKAVYFQNFEPYSWKDTDGNMHGVLVDIMDEILHKRMGIKVEHAGYPWARAQRYVKNGVADGFLSIPTPTRATFTVVGKIPIFDSKFTMFTSRKNPSIKALRRVRFVSELKETSLIHYIGSGWANKNLRSMNVTWKPTMTEVLSLLAQRKYDVFIDVATVVQYQINKLGYQDSIIMLPQVFDTASFTIFIGKKSKFANQMPKFEKHIVDMKNDGTLDKIFKKYR